MKGVAVGLFIFLLVGKAVLICAEQDVGHFWHLTDMHFDTNYRVGAPAVTFCHDLSSFERPSGGLSVVDSQSSGDDPCDPEGDDECAYCRSLVCRGQQLAIDTTNVTKFVEELVALCSHFGSFADECTSLVKKYGAEIHTLFDVTDSFSVCRIVGICSTKAGPIADHWCSAPTALAKSALKFMSDIDPSPDFIAWTGDAPPQNLDAQLSPSFTLEAVRNATEMITEAFPKTLILPTIGNHDCWPKDDIPLEPGWELGNFTLFWKDLLPQDALKLFEQTGFYSTHVVDGLKIVALNTQLYYPLNGLIPKGTVDPLGQLKWLEAELDRSRQAAEKVIIIGHVPPGPNERASEALSDQWSLNHSVWFHEIVGKYGDMVLSQHYGHEHSDSFRVFSQSEEPFSVAYIAPAVSPKDAGLPNNPGVRLFSYDRKTFEILDYTQYWLDLTKSNRDDRAIWAEEYSARDAYSLKDMSPQSWYDAISGLESDDDAFQRYFRYNNARVQTPKAAKDQKRAHICALRNPTGPDFLSCMEKPVQ